MLDRKLKNISTKDLELAIAELLTNKFGESDFQVEIKNINFGFEYNYKTEMNIIIEERAFDHEENLNETSNTNLEIETDDNPF